MQTIIQLNDIHKSFESNALKTLALSNINLSVAQGEYLAITGPSGCGKSTLLSVLGILDTATSGQYQLAGQDVSALSSDQRAIVRGEQIGFVFQSFNLISDLTVLENVMLPLTYQPKVKQKAAIERAKATLELVDMSHRINHFPSALSGGQQQRAAIARALINDPKLILADEPTGNLDSKNADMVLQLFDTLHNQGRTLCMVTHDPRSAGCASRQLELFDGKLVSDRHTQQQAANA